MDIAEKTAGRSQSNAVRPGHEGRTSENRFDDEHGAKAQGAINRIGGFGGGGTDEPSSEQFRLWIARGSAVLARVDESPLNKAVLEALDNPITLRSDEHSTLGQMLKQIKSSVKTADGKKIAIYVDPVALKEAEKTLDVAGGASTWRTCLSSSRSG